MSSLFTMIYAGRMVSSDGVGSSPALDNNQKMDVPAVVQTQDETERFEQTYPINANGRVSISNVNGSITAEAWDRNEVKLSYVKTAETKERLADVEVKIDARPDSFKVETDYGNWNDRNNGGRNRNSGRLQVEYRLMIPR